jgi:hypothetical protein
MMRFRQKIKQENRKVLKVERILGSTVVEKIALIENQAEPPEWVASLPCARTLCRWLDCHQHGSLLRRRGKGGYNA